MTHRGPAPVAAAGRIRGAQPGPARGRPVRRAGAEQPGAQRAVLVRIGAEVQALPSRPARGGPAPRASRVAVPQGGRLPGAPGRSGARDVYELAVTRADGDDSDEALDRAFSDPIVLDVALHEGGWFDRFIEERGALAPRRRSHAGPGLDAGRPHPVRGSRDRPGNVGVRPGPAKCGGRPGARADLQSPGSGRPGPLWSSGARRGDEPIHRRHLPGRHRRGEAHSRHARRRRWTTSYSRGWRPRSGRRG